MLGHFLDGLLAAGHDPAVAVAPGSRMAALVPAGCDVVPVPDNGCFSPLALVRSLARLRAAHARQPFDVIHGWSARDWELATATGWLLRRPALGTLHDHPAAGFITRRRRRLMRLAARWGLRRVVCVSKAVQQACLAAGYPVDQLAVIHNGLPPQPSLLRAWRANGILRLGFLGAFSKRKGLEGLFAIVAALAARGERAWELHIAGEAQNAEGRRMMDELRARHRDAPWWPQIHWHGWVDAPGRFLGSLDVLVLPSSEFDPLPTVLLEAGQAGTPVLAASVGGVAEIILPGQTGWLFEPGDWPGAAAQVAWLAGQPAAELARCGNNAIERVARDFSREKMSAQYVELFSILSPNG